MHCLRQGRHSHRPHCKAVLTLRAASNVLYYKAMLILCRRGKAAPSSSGQGHRALNPATAVRICQGLLHSVVALAFAPLGKIPPTAPQLTVCQGLFALAHSPGFRAAFRSKSVAQLRFVPSVRAIHFLLPRESIINNFRKNTPIITMVFSDADC